MSEIEILDFFSSMVDKSKTPYFNLKNKRNYILYSLKSETLQIEAQLFSEYLDISTIDYETKHRIFLKSKRRWKAHLVLFGSIWSEKNLHERILNFDFSGKREYFIQDRILLKLHV